MVNITQFRVNEADLRGNILKTEEFKVKINQELIDKDINRLEDLYSMSKNKINKQNLKALKDYLKNFKNKIDENEEIEACWVLDEKNIIKTYPIEFINESIYNIDAANYIELEENEQLIEVSLNELADIIAFEYMYRDLNETHYSMEELLQDCGIVGGTPSDKLLNFIESVCTSPFNLSKSFYIEDSSYFNYEDKVIHDYFNTRKFKSKKYRDVVEYSCKYAATIVANNIVRNCAANGINCKLVNVCSTNISFIIDNNNEIDIKHDIIDDICIRAFGRMFNINTNIKIY